MTGRPIAARALTGLAALVLCAAASAQATAPAPSSPAKKKLVERAVQLQMPAIELLARGLVEQPAVQMLREAAQVLPQRVPAEQREAAGKRIEDGARRYVDEAAPLMRERALRLAPTALAGPLDEKFSEDELKQIVAWLESPVAKKYQQLLPEIQHGFVQKLVADARPSIDPKLNALELEIRSVLNLPTRPAQAPAPGGTAPRPGPAAPASGPR